MWEGFPLFPEQASTIAQGVDSLYLFLVGLTAFFSVLIFTVIFVFAIIYRAALRRRTAGGHRRLESAGDLLVRDPVRHRNGDLRLGSESLLPERPVARRCHGSERRRQAMDVEDPTPEGQREINELHVPIGRPVKLIMTSEDVIHSFFVPAFRIKMDVLPGRYTTAWFEATSPASSIVLRRVLRQRAFEDGRQGRCARSPCLRTLDQRRRPGRIVGPTRRAPFEELRCVNCHHPGSGDRGPSLNGIFGRTRPLEGGGSVVADEEYFRESVLNPRAKVVSGFLPVMPTFQGQISEEQLLELIAFVRTLEGEQGETP